jgi:uncharacterized membrane protein
MFILITLFFSIELVVVPSIHAQNYYADLTITVDSSGFVTIEGQTNYLNLTIKNTELYTSKQQNLWLLNITKQEIFSEFIYTVTLPKGSSINYIKSTGFIRIEESLGNLIVRGFGENESFSIIIQYQTEKKVDSILQETIVYPILLSAVILVSILLFILYQKEKKTKRPEAKEIKNKPLEEWKGLNHRQKQILQILQVRNIPLTQTDIQRELQIPKASISRNIRGLERKGLIEKETIGISNLIRLKKP